MLSFNVFFVDSFTKLLNKQSCQCVDPAHKRPVMLSFNDILNKLLNKQLPVIWDTMMLMCHHYDEFSIKMA